MQIDVNRESLIPLGELARSLPARRNNRPVHPSTLHRWRTSGLAGGIRLEAVRVGGAWHTSREAFARFCDRLTAAAEAGTTDPSPRRNSRGNHAGVDTELREEGW